LTSWVKLAKRFLLSLRHLNRKVNQITGLPPAKFVREVQLQKARQILEDGNFESISEVAYSVGFYQPSTFTALFKKRFGTTPSRYRNKHDSNFSSSSKKKDGM
jgi:AraC-like DNA-binding protein